MKMPRTVKAHVVVPFFLTACLSLVGCASDADYMMAPEGAIKNGTGPRPVDPDDFAVVQNKYPSFHVAQQFVPPPSAPCWIGGCSPMKMAPMLPADVWHVTHMVKGRYLIESNEYNERQCRYLDSLHQNPAGGGVNILGHCLQAYEFAIYVTLDGKVDGGWQILPGSQKVFSARETFLGPSDENAALWPADFSFLATK